MTSKDSIARIPELAGGLAGAAFGDYERLVKVVGEAGVELLEPLRCNPDGTSKYDLSVYPEGAANTRASVLKAKGEDKYIAEKEISADLIERIGAENHFTFTEDWRMGQVEKRRQARQVHPGSEGAHRKSESQSLRTQPRRSADCDISLLLRRKRAMLTAR